MPNKLSIVIPAYNEERYIKDLLRSVLAVDLGSIGFSREVIVVDDGSSDQTAAFASSFPEVILHRQPQNGGKGSAVVQGIHLASGDWLMIQDADLEYDPQDYLPMLRLALANPSQAVYGSRYLRFPSRGLLYNLIFGKYPSQSWPAYLGGRSLSLIALLFARSYLTDTVTALKLFPTSFLRQLTLESRGFELDHELTAKVLAAGFTITETPISYFPRSKLEGKKIGLRDWFRACRTFYRFRR